MPEEDTAKTDTTLPARRKSWKAKPKTCQNQTYIKFSELPSACETDPTLLILQRYGKNGILPNGNRQPHATFLKFADRRASAAHGATTYKCTNRIHYCGTAKYGEPNLDDATSFHPGQSDICDCCNPPDIQFQAFRKTDGSDDIPKAWDLPPMICTDDGVEIRAPIEDKVNHDEHGEALRNDDGSYVVEYLKGESGNVLEHPLYDFEILPLRISRAESAWMFEMWTRLDPRITWADIAVRMKFGDGGRRPTRNSMNMACFRLRKASGMKEWGRGRKHPNLDNDTNTSITRIDVKLPAPEKGWNPFGHVRLLKGTKKRMREHHNGSPEEDPNDGEDSEAENDSPGIVSSTQKRKRIGKGGSDSLPGDQGFDAYGRSQPIPRVQYELPHENQLVQQETLPGQYEVPMSAKVQEEVFPYLKMPVIGRNQLQPLQATLVSSLYSSNRFPTPEDIEEAYKVIPAALRHSVLHLHTLEPGSTITVEPSRDATGAYSDYPPTVSRERSPPMCKQYLITVEDQLLPKWLRDYYYTQSQNAFT